MQSTRGTGQPKAFELSGISVALAAMTLVMLSIVLVGPVAGRAQAAFPGGPNGTIVFECGGYAKALGYNTPTEKDICAMNADASEQKRLIATPGLEESPVWSSSFDKIAFTCSGRDGEGDKDICVMNADGSGQQVITHTGTNPNHAKDDYDPSWSPDGTKLAFTSKRGGNLAVYTMNTDGTGVKKLTQSGALDYDPAWSPDGTKIAVTSYRHYVDGRLTPRRDIYVMNADGTDQTPLVTDHAAATTPAWSPDGTKIAYTGNSDPGLYGTWYYDVFVKNLDGSGKKNLTKGTHFRDGTAVKTNAYEAAWSPDGKKLVFTGHDSNLSIINADGTNRRDLPRCSGEISYTHTTPDWGVGSVTNGRNCGSITNEEPPPDGDTSAPDNPTLYLGSSDTGSGTGAITSDTTPTFSGTAEPGSTVKLYEGGVVGGILLGEVKAGGDGNWEYTLESPLGDGTLMITATATDTSGNTSGESAALEVTIDTTGPSISVPQNLAPFEAKDPNGATVSYDATATDAVDGLVSVSCDPPSGSTFPIGTTTVTCTATDVAGNTSTKNFSVTVQDSTAPVISGVPFDVTKAPTGTTGTVVTYTPPTAQDAVDGSVSVNCEPPPGSTFPIGTTTVTCTATDATKNTSTATFKVSILYGWNGFLQPINDTAHQTGIAQSKFKLGQTIPVRFALYDAAGTAVQQTGKPTFTRSGNRGSCDSSTTLETEVASTADPNAAYTFNGGQYHYNWSTKGLTAGEYRIYANLADGTNKYVDICLRK